MDTSPVGERVRSCRELASGLEARIKGVTHIEGSVTEIMPKMRLFWVVSPSGVRRIVELDEYEIYRSR